MMFTLILGGGTGAASAAQDKTIVGGIEGHHLIRAEKWRCLGHVAHISSAEIIVVCCARLRLSRCVCDHGVCIMLTVCGSVGSARGRNSSI